MSVKTLSCALLAGAAFALISTDVMAASAQEERQKKQAEIPHCAQPLGNLAVEEPQRNWWAELKLGSPEALIKVFVQQSGCFSLVDRGAGLAAAQRERALASGGGLQQGSNVGGGQIIAADYVLVPDIISQNGRASGNSLGGALGGLLGGPVLGAIAGSISFNSSTADVTLAITNVRTTQVMATIDGHSKKTDIGFGVGGGVFGYGGFGAAGATGYNNTEIGQVITLAYLDAYTKLVDQLGGLPGPGGASSAAAQQMVTATRGTSMFSGPSTQSPVVRPIDQGMRLYPTGQKNGLMWEVKDELGNTGWVSSIMFELAK
ncbi:MAG TPA: SH3 domain-containing protein [Micropepsaceae bacterium]|jgi:curli biogenesis system outer membrane secretion channel CsgG|nr:SH3 domain-containing protein [Micropepsaceae bacterium]